MKPVPYSDPEPFPVSHRSFLITKVQTHHSPTASAVSFMCPTDRRYWRYMAIPCFAAKVQILETKLFRLGSSGKNPLVPLSKLRIYHQGTWLCLNDCSIGFLVDPLCFQFGWLGPFNACQQASPWLCGVL